MKRFILDAAWLGLLALACVLTGCKTTDAAHTGSLASVLIAGHTAEEIQRTAIEVFEWNGYARVSGLTFKKQGTKWDTIPSAVWCAEAVWIKMRVTLNKRGGGSELWRRQRIILPMETRFPDPSASRP